MKSSLIFLFCVTLFLSCSKKDNAHNGSVTSEKCGDATHAVLVNKTGVDGCRWALELDNGDYLEPTNLSDFDLELVDKKSVAVKYTVRNDLGSVCMIGVVVDLDCIDEHYQDN